jgi:hypothetical protein
MHPNALRLLARLSFPVVALTSSELALAGGDAKPASPPGVARHVAGAARGVRHDTTHVLFDEPGDGSIWARGASYKVSFGNDGAVVVPFLGAHAPTNHPLALRPTSLARGGAAIPFASQAPARRDGDSIRFDRGTFVERYELDPQAIEQTFVIDRVAGTGDLVLRIDASTDLASSEDAASLRFENGLGGILYGRAKAIDARGAGLALETHATSGGIEIRVPSAFLDAARFPVVIDPVVSTFAIDTTASDDFTPDVAYDASTNRYMVCYEETYSATDHDVYEELLDATGIVLAGGYIDFTTNDWRHPRIANNYGASQFMAVAHVGAAPQRQIWSRVITSSSTFGAQTPVAGTFADTDQVDPDIGGTPYPNTDDGYMVAWEFLTPSTGERDIVQMLMHTSGLPDGGTAICVDCGAGLSDVNPAVSKSCGGSAPLTDVWNVVWEYEFSSTDHDIYGAQLANETQIAGPFPIDTSTLDDRRPSVSSFAEGTTAPGNYLAVWDRAFPTDHDIIGCAMNGASVVSEQSLSFLEGPTFYYQDQIEATVDSDGCAFAVAYSEQYSTSTTDYDVYVSTFDVAGGTIDALETHQNLAFTSLPELDTQITAARGGPALRYMAAWTRQVTGNSDIYGGLYDSGTVVNYCYPGANFVQGCPCNNAPTVNGGCNNSINTGGAILNALGTQSLSSDTFSFTQTGELGSSLSIFLQGNADVVLGTTFGDGVRCVGGTLKRLYHHNASSGTVSAPVGADLAVSARSAQLGDTIAPCSSRFYQVYYRDPNLGFCASGFNVGNGVKALWLP